MEESCITGHLERTRTYILQNEQTNHEGFLKYYKNALENQKKMKRRCGKEKNVILMLKREDAEGIILNQEEKSVIYLVITKPHYM